MIVEFIGTPGAGKTTLLPAVTEYLQEQGICARSVVEAARPYAQRTLLGAAVSRLAPPALRRPLLWQVFYHLSALYSIRFCVKHAKLIRQVLGSQKSRPVSADVRERRVLYWFFRLVGYYEFLIAHARPGEALVFDEGFIHRVVQMNVSEVEEPDAAQVLAYVDLLPRPDLVIFPQASPEVCERRIYRRGLWEYFRYKSPPEVLRFIANADLVVSLAVEHVKSKGWTVIEVDNGGDDPMVSEAELRSKLTKLPAFACEMPELSQTA